MRMASGRRKERERAHLIDIPTELLLYHQFPSSLVRCSVEVWKVFVQSWKVIGMIT